jgi:hypothetical protein
LNGAGFVLVLVTGHFATSLIWPVTVRKVTTTLTAHIDADVMRSSIITADTEA